MTLKADQSRIQRDWTNRIKQRLVGRTIVGVRYMTSEEADASGWHHRPVVLILDDGHILFPMMDDEGNDGGALATSHEDLPTIPVMV